MHSLAAYAPTQILQVNRDAEKGIATAQKRVGFALGVLGHAVDCFGAFAVRRVNNRLAGILVRSKGLVAVLPEVDKDLLLDPDGKMVPHFAHMQQELSELHAAALKARADAKLRRTHEALRELVELCVAFHDALDELKHEIVEHDRNARLGEDGRRIAADLRRTDDVDPGLYADLAAVLRSIPQEKRHPAH